MNINLLTAGVMTLAGLSAAVQSATAPPPAAIGKPVEPVVIQAKQASAAKVSQAEPAQQSVAPAAEVAPASQTVTVEPGDYLSAIAGDHQTTYVRLYDANPQIVHPDVIHPGDSVRIPAADEQLGSRPLPADAQLPEAERADPVAAAAPARQPGPPAPAAVGGSVWDRLAQCESGGNWAINTGNGYYGGLQFNASTWLSNGGGAYAEYAHLATRDQQIAVAQKLAGGRGFAPWPACSAKLGL